MAIIIDKERSYKLFIAAQNGDREARNEIGEFIINLTKAIMSRASFKAFFGEQRQYMIDEAIYQCSLSIDRWDPNKKCTPYSYMQMIVCRALIQSSVQFKNKRKKDDSMYANLKFDYKQETGGF